MRSQSTAGRYPQSISIPIAEPVRLAMLGTATYLSYWKVLFAFCGACVGQGKKKN